MHIPNRRIVTGLNAEGKSCVIIDGAPVAQVVSAVRPGGVAAFVWRTTESPASNEGVADAAAEPFGLNLAPGATGIVLYRYPGKKELASLTAEDRERVQKAIAEERARALSAGSERPFFSASKSKSSRPGMHATNTIDYVIVLQGKMTLILEDGDVTANAGDIIVDRGVAHDWENRGDETVIMASVMIDAVPLGEG